MPGRSGAKLTGAGGGGFLLVICPMEQQRAVRRSLADMRELPVKLDRLGSRVVLNVTARYLGLMTIQCSVAAGWAAASG